MRLDLAKSGPLPFQQNGLYGFLDSVSSGPEYPIEILLVHEANPSYSLAENKLFQAAAAKVATLVSFSSYMDETAAYVDLILPNHTAFERWDDVVGIPGASFGYYAVSAPVIKPLLDTRHTGDALLALAGGIGGSVGTSMPWKNYEEYLKFRVTDLPKRRKDRSPKSRMSQSSSFLPGNPFSRISPTVQTSEKTQGRLLLVRRTCGN